MSAEFYIDNDNRLWAKSDKGDELVTDFAERAAMQVVKDNYKLSSENIPSIAESIRKQLETQVPDGPCSCLAHHAENCSECFDVQPTLMSQEFVANVRVKYNTEAAGDFEDSIEYLIEQLSDYHGVVSVDVEVSEAPSPNAITFTFSETDGREFAQPPSNRVFGFGDGVIAFVDDGPNTDGPNTDGPSDELEEVGEMTVDEMLEEIAVITESIYPNQSEALLPKFELVLRALYERAIDSQNIG